MDMKKTVTALSVAALAASTAALPAAAADISGVTGIQIAACNPCAAKRCEERATPARKARLQPCAAKKGCNPCAAKEKVVSQG